MYEVRNKHGMPLRNLQGVALRDMVLNAAKARAEACYKDTGEHHGVFEVKQVWTTQTLSEAMEVTPEMKAGFGWKG